MADAGAGGSATRELVTAAASAMMQALQQNQLDVAACELEAVRSLTGRTADDPDILLFRVIIAIQRGQSREALQYLNELGEDSHPELRALCLYSLQDPYWEGLAREVADSTEPVAAAAMSDMLASYAAASQRGMH